MTRRATVRLRRKYNHFRRREKRGLFPVYRWAEVPKNRLRHVKLICSYERLHN